MELISLTKACVFLGLGGACLFFYWSVQEQEPVEEIKIHRNRKEAYLKAEEVLGLAKIEKSRSYTPRELSSLSSLLAAHPAILSASLRQEAKTLHIYLKERECIAIVEDKGEKTVYDVDTEGRIFSHTSSRCKKVPLLRGSFPRGGEGDFLSGENAKRLLKVLVQIKRAYPELSARFSELRVNSEGGLSLFLLASYLRIDFPFEADEMMIRRLYASVAYLTSQKIKHGWLDLRGPEAILHAR